MSTVTKESDMKGKILIIDDEIDSLETYVDFLSLYGYSVITSTTAKHGIELYQKDSPCIVFSDISMPDMDGYELFSEIRKLDQLAKVVFIAGYLDKEKVKIAINNGLLDAIEKPIHLSILIDKIKKYIC